MRKRSVLERIDTWRWRVPRSGEMLTEGLIFVLIALLFIVRPQGFVTVRRAERV